MGPYRRMARIGRPLPTLVVCDSEQVEENFLAMAGKLALFTTTMARALAGPLTGGDSVWRSPSGEPAALHCPRRGR